MNELQKTMQTRNPAGQVWRQHEEGAYPMCQVKIADERPVNRALPTQVASAKHGEGKLRTKSVTEGNSLRVTSNKVGGSASLPGWAMSTMCPPSVPHFEMSDLVSPHSSTAFGTAPFFHHRHDLPKQPHLVDPQAVGAPPKRERLLHAFEKPVNRVWLIRNRVREVPDRLLELPGHEPLLRRVVRQIMSVLKFDPDASSRRLRTFIYLVSIRKPRVLYSLT